jgi:hypothetical protein
MNKKYFIFKFLLTQSSNLFSSLHIDYNANRQTWTINTDRTNLTVQPYSQGTKIQAIKGTLLKDENETSSLKSFDAIYGAGYPVSMKTFQIDPETTVLVWVALIQQYHLLTFNHKDPKNIIYSRISSLKSNDEDAPDREALKELLRKNPYLDS